MKVLVPKVTLLALIVLAVFALQPNIVGAEHNSFRFKWPYRPGVSHPTTRLPFENGHADAWDVVIGDNNVVASAEGTVVASLAWYYDPDTCNPGDGGGWGNHVRVQTGSTIVTYAHLASTPFRESDINNTAVIQGAFIGIQGKTGSTRGSEPPNNCGTHLHFQFNPAHPSAIDGQAVTSQTPAGPSTNSYVGNLWPSGLAIYFKYLGAGSWAGVGWTADPTGNHAGCLPNSFCRLYVHYQPNPVEGHWGSIQFFRQHPTLLGGFEYGSIEAGRWAVSNAYRVGPAYFGVRIFSGLVEGSDPERRYPIGLPLMDQIGSFPLLCEEEVGCVNYQRFHVGYIWSSWLEGNQAIFCPDVYPAYPGQDYRVRIGDIVAVNGKYGLDDPSAPYEPWSDSWYDIDGNGMIRVQDINLVLAGYGANCYPE